MKTESKATKHKGTELSIISYDPYAAPHLGAHLCGYTADCVKYCLGSFTLLSAYPASVPVWFSGAFALELHSQVHTTAGIIDCPLPPKLDCGPPSAMDVYSTLIGTLVCSSSQAVGQSLVIQ